LKDKLYKQPLGLIELIDFLVRVFIELFIWQKQIGLIGFSTYCLTSN